MTDFKRLDLPGKLIYINVVVFIITQVWCLIQTLFCLSGYDWQDYLALHSSLGEFLFKPWTLLTYFFTHANLTQDIFHILFNMLWLWWFGQFFLRYHTGRQFLSVYLLGGIFAGLFFLLAYNVFPYFTHNGIAASVVGASGAIFALIVAVAMRSPEETLYLNLFVRTVSVKMKWVAAAVIAINLLSLPSSYNTGGIICHIGGALWGFVYGYYESKGKNVARWFERICDKIVNFATPRPRMQATRGGARTVNADKRKDMEYNASQKQHQERIDAILDKISKSGYDGLSAEEKQMLFDASHRKRK